VNLGQKVRLPVRSSLKSRVGLLMPGSSVSVLLEPSWERSRLLRASERATLADWHGTGFPWDGSAGRLYVDNVLDAEGQHKELAPSNGGLMAGCGALPELGTFCSGLIDDVRTYHRALKL
jgi:hypothetical protein